MSVHPISHGKSFILILSISQFSPLSQETSGSEITLVGLKLFNFTFLTFPFLHCTHSPTHWIQSCSFEQKCPTQFHPLASQWTSLTGNSNKKFNIYVNFICTTQKVRTSKELTSSAPYVLFYYYMIFSTLS